MKDPAILLYTGDFIAETMTMTMRERGQLITLMCLQHRSGHFTLRDINITVGRVSERVMDKLEIDEEGKYYHPLTDLSMERRRKNSEAQSLRALKRWHAGGNAGAMHIVNENERERENIYVNNKGDSMKGGVIDPREEPETAAVRELMRWRENRMKREEAVLREENEYG